MVRASFRVQLYRRRSLAVAKVTGAPQRGARIEDGKAMRNSKHGSRSDARARAPRKEPKPSPGLAQEDECCALLRRYPIAAPASAPRPPRAHESRWEKRT